MVTSMKATHCGHTVYIIIMCSNIILYVAKVQLWDEGMAAVIAA